MKINLYIFAFFLFVFFQGNSQNLIDSSDWVAGTSGATTNYSLQGTTSQNSRILDSGPFGNQVVVWEAAADGASGMNGGFSHNGVLLDTNKTYQFTFWVKSSGPNGCANRIGYVPYGNNALITTSERVNGTTTTWPYFFSANLPNDKWYLVVAYIHPNSYQGSDLGGVYDPSDIDANNPNILPSPAFSATDFKFPSTLSQVNIHVRNFMWDCASGEYQYSYEPRIEEVTGQENSPMELMSPCSISGFSTEYSINGTWSNGATSITVDEGDTVVLSALPNTNSVTIIDPNGNTYGDNHDLGTVVSAQAGTYTISMGTNCTTTLELIVNTSSGGGSNGGGSTNNVWTETGTTISYGETTGNVAIGTTTVPAGHKLAVNGSIITTEVLVKLKANWADYVFKENYTLPTLKEVAKHIKEKGHLINIPSAKEVKANGIELGEMNKLLLEKIEELTLYILEQEKRIQVLEETTRINN